MTHIDYEHLYRDVLPSVVSIYVSTPRRPVVGGAGSGFVADDAGHVITNQHVVGPADRVEVRFSRGDWRVAEVVGADAYTDLAVVRVDDLPEYARPLALATENPAPGRPVAALGNPLGLDGSITAGIVSGSNRSMATGAGFAVPDVVQTDAAINPGNSGGPLVALAIGGVDVIEEMAGGRDSDGDGVRGDDGSPGDGDVPGYEVVGVNRAKQGDNIGFAVSAEMVALVVPALIEEGEFHHSYLRIRTMDVTPTLASANGLDEPRGVLVVDVHPSVPDLYGCGEERRVRGRPVPVGGDVIVGIDGVELRSHEELMRHLIAKTSPGESVVLDVLRDGRSRTVEVTLAERPTPETERRRPRSPHGGRRRNGKSGRQVPIE